MVLSDISIKKALDNNLLVIEPFDPSSIQPSSVDLKLGKEFLIFKNAKKAFLDFRKDDPSEFMEKVVITDDEPIIVHPKEFILGTTVERVTIPADIVARLEGKSSLGRLGIIVHATAGYVDPGFEGDLTLEISNMSNIPIALYSGMKICQITFFQMTTKAKLLYGDKRLKSHYQGQKGVTASRIG